MKPMTVAAIIVLLATSHAAAGAARSDDSLKKKYGWLERIERLIPQTPVRYDVKLTPLDISGPTGDHSVFTTVGRLGPHSRETKSFVLPKITWMKVFVLGDPSWSFRSPRGDAYAPGDSAGHPRKEFGPGLMGLSGFILENPSPGTWTVTMASKADTTVEYAVVINPEGPAEESVHLELSRPGRDPRLGNLAEPGDAVYVRAFVAKNREVVTGTRWTIRAWDTGDSAFDVPMFDDGNHADGKAGDGVFVGAILAWGPDGHYRIVGEGRTPGGVRYGVVETFELQTKNDLVMLDSLVVSPRQPRAGEPVTFMVTVMNDGVDEFKGVPLELSVDRDVVSERHVDLKPREPRRMMMVWIPPTAGSYDVHLTLYSYDEPYWSDGSNSHRIKIVEVR